MATNSSRCSDLSAAVDVYSDWVDACDAVAKEGEAGGDHAPERPPDRRTSGAAPKGGDDDDDDDDDIMGDEDGLGGYSGEGVVGDDEY
jgi:transcription elongation factor Elf1